MSSPDDCVPTHSLESDVQLLSVADAPTDKSDSSTPSRPVLSRQSSTRKSKSRSGTSTPHIAVTSPTNDSSIRSTRPSRAGLKSSDAGPDGALKTAASSSTAEIVVKSEAKSEEEAPRGNGTLSHPKQAKSSRKLKPTSSRPPLLYTHLEDKTEEATSQFQVITESIYSAKYLGLTEHALECDCAEERDENGVNQACGEDSDCINRATKMECTGECGCGPACQNQRFQSRHFADVSVIRTEKKGYGLRANADLMPNQFIFEYIGEVINEPNFRKRMAAYDQEGIKHFYFMSLTKGEFVDATRKGNLGRFCNHSCNPNCYVDKWVVGNKLRMGIFAERYIKAGEELVFNYNVDRYGADPQPCYCGEDMCQGFIGGKTQTDSATKLSVTMIEALGIEDDDVWNIIPKKPKKRKTEERDEDYDMGDVKVKTLSEEEVTKVMATLMQCKEKWVVVKLLTRLQRCQDEKVLNRVSKMHGYQILKSTLSAWIDDCNVVLQVIDVLFNLPRITRNKIQDSKIEDVVQKAITTCADERVTDRATELLGIWSKLEVGYRIPLLRRDSTSQGASQSPKPVSTYSNRRPQESLPERRPHRSPPPSSIPTGPRATRGAAFFQHRPRQPRLPPGWFPAYSNGQVYYYTTSGQTTWEFPTRPAEGPAMTAPAQKSMTEAERLDAIIQGIVQNTKTSAVSGTESSVSGTPAEKPGTMTARTGSSTAQDLASSNGKDAKKDRWKSWSLEKQMKLYENTLFPIIRHVMNKYKEKLPREDLKRFGKEISKKLVASDYKNNRVTDPTVITEKQERQVKKFVKEFFDKAVVKRKEHQKKKQEREGTGTNEGGPAHLEANTPSTGPEANGVNESGTVNGSMYPTQKALGTEDDDEHRDMLNVISDDEDDAGDGNYRGSPDAKTRDGLHYLDARKRKLRVSEGEVQEETLSAGSITPLKKARTQDAEDEQTNGHGNKIEGGDINAPNFQDVVTSSSAAVTPPPPPPPPPGAPRVLEQTQSLEQDGDLEAQTGVQTGIAQSQRIQT